MKTGLNWFSSASKSFNRFFTTGIQLHYRSMCHRYALGIAILPQQLMITFPQEGMLAYLLIKTE